MKYAFFLGAAVLVAVASYSAATPVDYSDEQHGIKWLLNRVTEKTKELTNVVAQLAKETALSKIQALKDMKDKLMNELDNIRSDIHERIRDMFVPDDDLYVADEIVDEITDEIYGLAEIRQKIRELRQQVFEKTKQLVSIAAQLAKETAATKIEELKNMRGKVMDEIRKLRAQIRQKIREMFVPDDDTYATSETIATIKAKIVEHLKTMRQKRNELKDLIGEKRQRAIKELRQMRQDLRDLVTQLRKVIRESIGKDEATYAMEEEQYGLLEMVRALRENINEKLSSLLAKVEIAKQMTGAAKQEAMKIIAELKKELVLMRNDLTNLMKEMFGRA